MTPIINAPASNLPFIGANAFAFAPLPSISSVMTMLNNIGATAVRIEVPWADTELSLGVYAVRRDLDAWIAACRLTGRNVVLVLDYGNGLYPGSGGWNLPPRDTTSYNAFANYAAYLVAQYAGPDVWFEIYNEPNNPQFWANAVNPTQYAGLLSACITKMRAVPVKGATAKILTAGVGPVASADDQNPYMLSVINAVGQTNMAKLTGQSIHPYDATRPPEQMLTFIDNYRSALSYAGPLAITEMGWPSQWIASNETTRALYIARLIGLAIFAGVPLLTMYNLFDTGVDQSNVQFTFGLHKFDQTPKLAVKAFKSVMDALAGTVTYDAEKLASPNIYRITLRKGDGTVTKIIWSDAPQTSIVEPMATVTSLNDVIDTKPWFRFMPGGIMITVGPTNPPYIINGTL